MNFSVHPTVALFAEATRLHLRRWGLAYVGALMLATWFHENYALGLNSTHSLPGRLFLIERRQMPERGELVAFRWPGGRQYPPGATFIKVLTGLPGDTVTRVDGVFHLNGLTVGSPKALDSQGLPLVAGPTGTLPAGRFFVWTPHPDSLDSRYDVPGWITQEQILGRAHVLF